MALAHRGIAMSEKHWKVCDVECVAGFRIALEGSERAVAIAIQRDPNAHGLDGISADEALCHARLIAAAPELYEAVAAVIDATRDYLPPDGITKDEFISRVISATDNARLAEIMK